MTAPATPPPPTPATQPASPAPEPWDTLGQTQANDALENITRMMTGTKILQDQPGVIYALQQQQAHPEDAQAIDQFMQGLDAERQVRLASASGQKIILSNEQKTQLQGLGMDYSKVEYTHQDAVNDAIKATVAQVEAHGQQVKRNPDGSVALDANGNVQIAPHNYKAKGIGRLFHDLNNDVLEPVGRDVLKPIGTVASKGFNLVSSVLGGGNGGGFGYHDPMDLITHPDTTDPNSVGIQGMLRSITGFGQNSFDRQLSLTESQSQDMQNKGYDPQNFWSVLAYRASGKATGDTADLNDKYGTDAVNQAEQYLNNPGAYLKSIENNPANFTLDAQGNQVMKQDAADQLKHLSSPEFKSLAAELGSRNASIGAEVTNALGIDPVNHPTAWAITSAGANLAAGFMIDPIVLAGGAFKAARMAQVGIDSLADSNRAAAILDPSVSTGRFAQALQARTQTFIDMTHQLGAADAAGDVVQAAALTAHINARFPEWAPLIPDVLGKNQITGYAEKLIDGKRVAEPTYGEGEPIRNLADMATYIASKDALIRLMNGRAAAQVSLMPGSVSSFGLRKLKGITSEWMTERSAARAQAGYDYVVSQAKADPGIAEKLIASGDLMHTQPEADDAIDAISKQVVADVSLRDKWQQEYQAAVASGDQELIDNAQLAAQNAESQLSASRSSLASAQRAASNASDEYSLTAAGKGNIALNMRRFGTPMGGTIAGWAGPSAIAARTRLAAQRISTLLPRNTLIDINDSASSEKIYKLAMTYLNRGDANALRAAWDLGDGGQRKAIISGLIDQLGHAAGLGKSPTGQQVLDAAKAQTQSYSTVGDEVSINGQNVALHAGQVRTKWLLPTFQALQQASSKVGLWEATMGRGLTSNQADMLMSQWKLGALFKPSTVTRNQLEGWLRTALEGKFGDAVKAKAIATMPNKELWARGLGDESRVQYERLLAGGKTEEAEQLARSNLLGGEVLGRSGPGQRIAEFAPFALAGRAYRYMVGNHMDEATLQALATLSPEELSHAMEGYGQRILESDLGFKNAARQSTEIAKAGYGPALLRRSVNRAMRKGDKADAEANNFTLHETGDMIGAERYSNALGQRVTATPGVARAAIDFIEHPDQFDISHVVQALDDPSIAAQMHLTGYGSVYWTDPAKEAIKALTPAQVLIGKEEWANKVVNDYRYLLTGQNGQYQKKLADLIHTTGRAPDADWITNNLVGGARPLSVLAPEVTAIPSGGERGLISALQDVEGGAYQWLVERPLQRTTSSPVFLANYAQARVSLNPFVENLVEQGISREAAESLARETAIRNAWVKTEQLIDDPGQKSQFDVVARNMFPFSRATQAMIRRWGGGMWQDPTRARKLMLAYEGAVHSGFVYPNAYGEPTFVYPGSGVMNALMREVSKIPGLEGLARFPVSASMTGGVLMSVPGADNPLRMSMGPMITIPLREISKLLPGDQKVLFDEIDSAINGPVGQGETWQSLEPTLFKRFYSAMDTNQRNSALASSTIGAISNLAAAGMVPSADASPEVRQQFLNNIQAQVRSQLFLRAIFGIFAPASPSQPSEGTAGSQSDYAFSVRGIGQLSDEYKAILNDVGGDLGRANAIWTALHPDAMVYEIAHTQATTSKVSLPATQSALEWMTAHAGFVQKYGSVAAYFLPQDTGNEPFSDQAYKEQIALGLRQRKTPTEFMNDLYVRNAEAVFYPAVDKMDAQIAALKAQGQNTQQLLAAKSDWETQFKNLNPLFGQKIDAYPDARATATGQVGNLRQMLQDGDVPNGQAGPLANLIAAYDGYESFIQAHKGSNTADTTARDQALYMFNTWAQQTLPSAGLTDLFNGVFRVLNTNFVKLGGTG